MSQQLFDVFISYSHNDYVDKNKNIIPGNDVSQIINSLTQSEISFWFDEKGIIPGEDYAEKILKHIKACKVFIYLSSAAANEAEWTRKEIACALVYKKHLITVRLDDSPYHDSVMLRIADLDRIDYFLNPQKGISKLVKSIQTYLKSEAHEMSKKDIEDQKRKDIQAQQDKALEEEKLRQERIEQIESEIAAEESRLTEFRKTIVQKEKELELARVDYDNCANKLKKLQEKLKKIGSPINQIANNNPIIAIMVGSLRFNMIRIDGLLSSFYIGETPVTQELWSLVMGNNPSYFKGNNRPVESISYYDCLDFIDRLNSITGMVFRLPNEEEWEYAAKGGDKSQGFEYSGSSIIDDVAWYDKNSCDGVELDSSEYGTHNVKLKNPNELGIYDMSGNVWEWCSDLYDTSQTLHVLRGGSWFNYARDCAITNRSNFNMPNHRDNFLGLRLVLNTDQA